MGLLDSGTSVRPAQLRMCRFCSVPEMGKTAAMCTVESKITLAPYVGLAPMRSQW